MTLVPLPDTPCVRCRFVWHTAEGTELSTRLFLSYTGGPPSGADLTSLADVIETVYTAHLLTLVSSQITLIEIDLLDLASYSGNSGAWVGAAAGSRAGGSPPIQVAFNLQYLIGRRYRGGKPKGYWPFGTVTDLATLASWSDALVAAVDSQFATFIADVVAESEASIALAAHINLSYKHLFDNVTNSSGREHAIPRYKATASHDLVVGYKGHTELTSQRRRRVATTP